MIALLLCLWDVLEPQVNYTHPGFGFPDAVFALKVRPGMCAGPLALCI